MKAIAKAAEEILFEWENEHLEESARFIEAIDAKNDLEGPMVKVVLVTEGLGNRRNMNYYGPEAMQSAPPIFEGKPCFLNHPSSIEEQDIPERRVESKCGYFKNVRVQPIDGMSSVIGELHFDLSETGQMGFAKALTSLHYKTEFPGLDSEYVGLSINADGDVEKRMVQWEGETLEVNYVTRFTDAASCDIVTTPARGGKFLALVESIAGALNKEDTPMKEGLKQSLEKVRSLLKEATKAKNEDIKKKMTEACESFEAFLKEAAKADVEAKKDDDKILPVKEANPVKKGFEASLVCPHCNKGISMPKKEEENCESEDESKMKQDESEDESKGKQGESEDEGESEKKEAAPKKDDDGKTEPDDDDVIESKRLAIKALLVEAGLEKHLTVEDYEKKSLKEAKAEIEKIAKIIEADHKEMFSKTGYVPVGFRPIMTESKTNIDADAEFGASLKK